MKILIIEDDQEIIDFVSLAFKVGWPATTLLNTDFGSKGVEIVETEEPDIVIVDLGLPDISGFEAIKQIRLFSSVPIIVLTVRSEEGYIVKALEYGADDYIIKPFKQMELIARIKAIRRRYHQSSIGQPVIDIGSLQFDSSSREIFNGKSRLSLTFTEGIILSHLVRSAGNVVSYASLAKNIWGEDHSDSKGAIKVYIRRLRQKLEISLKQPRFILNKPGVGYYISKES